MSAGARTNFLAVTLILPLLALGTPEDAEAQGRGRGGGGGGGDDAGVTAAITAGVTFSIGDRQRIVDFYAVQVHSGLDALPPGIRRNLERGKPLPPGIAKKTAPLALQSTLTLREGFEIVEVGLDVLLVEVATGVIHDVLMDIIR